MKVNCDYCGKPISRAPSRLKTYEHHFCGRKCQNTFRSKNYRGEKCYLWRGGKTEATCDECGKPIFLESTQVNYPSLKEGVVHQEAIGHAVSRAEALAIANRILIQTEQERTELAEREATSGVPPTAF